jgi:hypothetical protein
MNFNKKTNGMRTTKQLFNLLAVMLLITTQLLAQSADSVKKAKAIELMKIAQKEYIKIKDYQATIVSSEIIDGRARKTEYIATRYLSPNHVYLKWQPGPYEGMQASYVPSRDKINCFMARETGIKSLIGTKVWSNNDLLIKIMYPHHFTIHQTNLAYLFETMQTIVLKGMEMNKLSVISIDEVIDKYTYQPVTSVMVKLSPNPKDGLMWPKVQIFFDKKQKLPFHFVLYDFAGNKSGEYAFTNFKMNTGLGLNDFAIK